MKRLFFVSIVFVFFISCATKPVPIPGEKDITIQNIYNEYLNLGDAYFEVEKYDKAVTYYNLAMQNSKLRWAVMYKLARTYSMQNKWDDSLALYEKLLKRDPENLSLKLSIAYIYGMTSNFDKSIAIYKDVLETNPEDQELRVNYIAVLLTIEDVETSTEQLAILKEKYPDNENIKKFEEKLQELNPSEDDESEFDGESSELEDENPNDASMPETNSSEEKDASSTNDNKSN